MFFKNLVDSYPVGAVPVSVIGYTLDQITDFLLHLIRQGHTKVLL